NCRSSALRITSCSTTCAASSRCVTCASARWRSAKLLTCSASPNQAHSIAPSNVGPASPRRNSAVNKKYRVRRKNKSGRGACPRCCLDWTSGGKPLFLTCSFLTSFSLVEVIWITRRLTKRVEELTAVSVRGSARGLACRLSQVRGRRRPPDRRSAGLSSHAWWRRRAAVAPPRNRQTHPEICSTETIHQSSRSGKHCPTRDL